MHKIFVLFILLSLGFQSFAQNQSKREMRKNRINQLIKEEEEGVINYQKQFLAGLKLTNDGYGGFMEIGRYKSVKKAWLFQLDIAERKHVKEEKAQLNPYNPNPLIYGKINYFYPVRLGVQQQLLLGNKSNKNGLQLTANYGGGLSLGILRAYEVEMNINGTTKSVYYDSPDSIYFLQMNQNPDVVGPTLFKGWSKVTMVPGAYAKAALRFDYALLNDIINALEIGVSGEFYSKKIPQMVRQKQKQYFVSPYVAILFGRRK